MSLKVFVLLVVVHYAGGSVVNRGGGSGFNGYNFPKTKISNL